MLFACRKFITVFAILLAPGVACAEPLSHTKFNDSAFFNPLPSAVVSKKQLYNEKSLTQSLNQLLPPPGIKRQLQLQILCKLRCNAVCLDNTAAQQLNDEDTDSDDDGVGAKVASNTEKILLTSNNKKSSLQQQCKQSCLSRLSTGDNSERCSDWVKSCEREKSQQQCWNAGTIRVVLSTLHTLHIQWQPPNVDSNNNSNNSMQYVALIASGHTDDRRARLLSTISQKYDGKSNNNNFNGDEEPHRWSVVEVDDPTRSELELTKICTDQLHVRLMALTAAGIVAISNSHVFHASSFSVAKINTNTNDTVDSDNDVVLNLRAAPLLLNVAAENRDVTTALEWNLPQRWSHTDVQYYDVDFQTEYCSTNFIPDIVPESRRPVTGHVELTIRLDCRYVFEITAVSVCNRAGTTARILIDASCAHISNLPAHLQSSLCKTSNVKASHHSLISCIKSSRNDSSATQANGHTSPLSLTEKLTRTLSEYSTSNSTAQIKLTWPSMCVASNFADITASAALVKYQLQWGPVETPFKLLPTVFQFTGSGQQSRIIDTPSGSKNTANMTANVQLNNFTTNNMFGFKLMAFIVNTASLAEVNHAAALTIPVVISASAALAEKLQPASNSVYIGWRLAFTIILASAAGVIFACCCCQWRGPRWCRNSLGIKLLYRQSSTSTTTSSAAAAWMMTPLTAAVTQNSSSVSSSSQLFNRRRAASSCAGSAFKTLMFEQSLRKQQLQYNRPHSAARPRSYLLSRLSQASTITDSTCGPMSVTLDYLPSPPPAPLHADSVAQNNGNIKNNNPYEIPRCQLELGECLGRGAFGQVVKAKYFAPSNTHDEYYVDFGRDSGLIKSTTTLDQKSTSAHYELGDGSVRRANFVKRASVVQQQQNACTDDDDDTLINKSDVRRVESGDSTSTTITASTSSSFVLTVAVKSTRADASDEDKLRFEREIELMSSIGQHAHVVTFIGYCWLSDDCYSAATPAPVKGLVLEYCPLGDLANYLRQARERQQQQRPDDHKTENNQVSHSTIITVIDQLSYARQIAIALEWLAEQDIVHRDVAARNVLMKTQTTVKVTDFGLARRLMDSSQSLTYDCVLFHKKRLPVKWLALESLENLLFSSASDVWAFGIVLYEIATLGLVPYDNVANADILALLKSGRRAEKPHTCSEQLYKIMSSCWLDVPDARPTFLQLKQELERLMQQLLLEENHYVELRRGGNQIYIN